MLGGRKAVAACAWCRGKGVILFCAVALHASSGRHLSAKPQRLWALQAWAQQITRLSMQKKPDIFRIPSSVSSKHGLTDAEGCNLSSSDTDSDRHHLPAGPQRLWTRHMRGLLDPAAQHAKTPECIIYLQDAGIVDAACGPRRLRPNRKTREKHETQPVDSRLPAAP